MPLPRRDFLEFLFNGGRGLKMEQIDGVQTHLTSTGWDNVTDPQHLIIGPTMASVPDEMLLFFRLPFTIPRTTRNLTARLGAQNRELPVVGIDGETITPRLLTPGALHGMLIDTGGARFIEMLPPRPQDWIMVGAWSYTPSVSPDTASILSAAELADPTTTEYTVPDFMVPQAPAGASSNTGRLFMGVPMDAPDLVRVERVGGSSDLVLEDVAGGEAPGLYNGVAYKWKEGACDVWVG